MKYNPAQLLLLGMSQLVFSSFHVFLLDLFLIIYYDNIHALFARCAQKQGGIL